MKRVSDLNHPLYRPLWVRVTLVAVTGAWACFENFWTKDPMWMVLTAGIFVYAAWVFLIKWVDPEDKPAEVSGVAAEEPPVEEPSTEAPSVDAPVASEQGEQSADRR